MRSWTCEVGPVADDEELPGGADLPMRQAVRDAFRLVVGREPERVSSGWGRDSGGDQPTLPPAAFSRSCYAGDPHQYTAADGIVFCSRCGHGPTRSS